MSYPRHFACAMAVVLSMVLACAPVPARAESSEAREALEKLEKDVLEDLTQALSFLTLEHKVTGALDVDGRLKLKVEVTTDQLREMADAQEVARLVTRQLSDRMHARWPRLALAPDSVLVTRRPFSFTEQLPAYSVPLVLPKPRQISLAKPRAKGRTAPGKIAPALGAVALRGPTVEELDLRGRVQRVFGARWIVTKVGVRIGANRKARVSMRITLVSQGLARDRERLRRATVEVGEVLRIAGRYVVDEGSEVRFDLFDAKTGEQTGGLLGIYRLAHWRVDGEEPPNESAPSRPGPARRVEPKPNGGGLPHPSKRPAVSASIPERNRKPRRHLAPRPPPDPEQAGPHRAVSLEDLVEVPQSEIGPLHSAHGRTFVAFTRVKRGEYGGVGQVENVTYGTRIAIVTAHRVETAFAFEHERQDLELAVGEVQQSGDAGVFSVKYRSPNTEYRNAHLAAGADMMLQSRNSALLRIPEAYPHVDSVWASYNLWSSPLSFLHLMIRRVGVFSRAREYAQFALAQELIAHHPLRRAYWELVVDDRVHKAFDVVGVPLLEPFAINVGVEFELGERAGLAINLPHLFSQHYRQAQIVLTTRL